MDLFFLAVLVVMGIMAGGMAVLAMIAPRNHQNTYGIGVGFGLVLGVASAILTGWPAVVNNLLNLILAIFIGYALTTFFVLAYHVGPDPMLPDAAAVGAAQRDSSGKTAVLYFVRSESDQYDVRVATRSFDTVDYPRGLPPLLLRPLYLLDLKRKYDKIGTNPHRALHFRLAQKVQDRLGKRYKVYIAFYNDHPTLDEVAAQAVLDGAHRLIVLHARLTNPPPSVNPAELLAPLHLARYGVSVLETTPLWNAELLPRLFVRRALAATEDSDHADVGLILIGRGHPNARRIPDSADESSPLQRQNQELTFQKRVRQALIKAGFQDDKVVIAWLRWQHPPLEGAYAQLITEGCRQIFWIGTGLSTDSIATLYDIPTILKEAAAGSLEPEALGPWNDDDLVAEALVERVKQVAMVEERV